MDTKENYSYAEAYEKSLEYFDGDELAVSTFVNKYALKNKDNKYLELTPDDMHNRLAKEFARIDKKYENPKEEKDFKEVLEHFKYIVPGGSVMYGVSNPYVNVSLSNCIALSGPGDSISAIFDKSKDMANLFKGRSGVGLPLDTLRPEGARVNNSAGSSTGAWSFANFYSEVCKMIGQNNRRGALMLTMNVKHPDIEKFVTMKRDLNKVTGANISVMITDEFMQAVEKDSSWTLQWPIDVDFEDAKYTKEIQAKDLWDLINESATQSAEPGLIFIDNYKKNLPADYYPEFESVCVNPCCFSKEQDVWVITDKGLKEIKEITNDDKIWIDDNQKWANTTGYFTVGKADIYKVSFADGEVLYITENHKLETIKNGKIDLVELKYLNIGEYIKKSSNCTLDKVSNNNSKKFLIDAISNNWFILTGETKGSSYIEVRNLDKNKIFKLKNILSLFGIVSTIDVCNEKTYLIINDNKSFRNLKKVLPDEHLIQKPLSEIKGKFNPVAVTSISNIEFLGPKDVGCIEVDKYHKFTANGLISGNSEILLSEYDSCRLTSINLKNFVINPFSKESYFDFDLFENVVRMAMRILDNIVDLEIEYLGAMIEKFDDESEKQLWGKLKEAAEKGRRTGLGTHGLADALACLGLKYDTAKAQEVTADIYENLRDVAYDESVNLAIDRGKFSCFDWEIDKQCDFIQRLPQPIQDSIKQHGRRNISLLTNAPTGSVSIISQTSSGIEPVFMNYYTRRRKISNDVDRVDFVDEQGDKWIEYPVLHHNIQGYLEANPDKLKKWESIQEEKKPSEWSDELQNLIPNYFVTAMDINAQERVKIQGIIQANIDHGISSTINLPKDTTVEEVQNIYTSAWKNQLKGVTVYVDGSRAGVLVKKEDNDDDSIIKESFAPKRPKELPCEIHHSNIDGQKWTIFVGLLDGQPYEIFGGLAEYVTIPKKHKFGTIVKTKNGKKNVNGRYAFYNLTIDEGDGDPLEVQNIAVTFNNGNYAAQTRMISLALRNGVPVERIAEQLSRDENSDFFSFSKVMARVLRKYISDGIESTDVCDECGAKLVFEGGCVICKNCSYSPKCH